MELIDLFQKNNFKPIEYKRKVVHISYDIEVFKHQLVEIEVQEITTSFPQYIWLMMDHVGSKGGYLKLWADDIKRDSVHVLVDLDNRKRFSFRCYPKGDAGLLRISNSWSYSGHAVDFGLRNTGICVEESEDSHSYLFCCNSGPTDITFKDLVFTLRTLPLDIQ